MLAVSPLTSFTPDALASELIRLRTDAHLSQRRLAELAGVSNTAISALESRHAPPPHPSALMKLANGLATSGSGALDERRAESRYLALMRAAGYLPPEIEDQAEETVRRSIIEEHLGHENTDLKEEIISLMRDKPRHDLKRLSELAGIFFGQ